jgi:hypothetical protein
MTTSTALATADLHSPVVDAAMGAAADMLGMEVVYIGGFTPDEFSMIRVLGTIPGLSEGVVMPRQASICDHMVKGAPAVTSAIRQIDEYAALPPVTVSGVTSYVGVPIRRDGQVVGTLCGIDRASVRVSDDVVRVLGSLAGVVEAHVATSGDTGGDGVSQTIRRTAAGWRVGSADGLDLTSAMVLADLLAADVDHSPRPPRGQSPELSELERLRLSVVQLEHALAARVVVEQAIGVLSERQHLTARAAFERLRKAARTRGRRVHDMAREVVASTTDTSVPIPPELAGRR